MVITWFLSGLASKVITTVSVWSSGGWEGEQNTYPQVAQLFSLLAFWRVSTLCSSLMICSNYDTIIREIHKYPHRTFSPASWNLFSSSLKYSSPMPGEIGGDFRLGLKSISAGRSTSTRKASSVSASSNSVTETLTACSLLSRFCLNKN